MADDVKYYPRNEGIRKLGLSAGVQDATLRAARKLERDARSIAPKTDYTVTTARIASGRHNELRAGAIVSDTMTESQGARKQSLKNAIRRNQR